MAFMNMVTDEFMIPIFYKGYQAENKYSNRGNYEAALNFQKIINEAPYSNITCRLYNIDERNDILHLAMVARQKRTIPNIPFSIPFLISCCQQDHLNSSLDIIRVQRPELNIIYSNSKAQGTSGTQTPKYSNSFLYSKILGHKYFPSYYGEIYRTEDDHQRTLNVFQRMIGEGYQGYQGLYKHEIDVNVGVYNRPDVVPDQIRDYDDLIHKMIKENDANNSWRLFYSKPKVNLKFMLLGSSDVRFTFDPKYINYITTDPKVFYKDIDLYLYPTIKNTDPIPNSQVICALNRIPIATNTVRGAWYSSKDELQFCTNEVTKTPPNHPNHLSSGPFINEAFKGMFTGFSQSENLLNNPQINMFNMFMLDNNQKRAKQLLQETKDAILALIEPLKKVN